MTDARAAQNCPICTSAASQPSEATPHNQLTFTSWLEAAMCAQWMVASCACNCHALSQSVQPNVRVLLCDCDKVSSAQRGKFAWEFRHAIIPEMKLFLYTVSSYDA